MPATANPSDVHAVMSALWRAGHAARTGQAKPPDRSTDRSPDLETLLRSEFYSRGFEPKLRYGSRCGSSGDGGLAEQFSKAFAERWRFSPNDSEQQIVKYSVAEVRSAAEVTTPVLESKQDRRPQVEANYRCGYSSARCGACEFYRAGGRCEQVAGKIDPDCVCDLYLPTRATSGTGQPSRLVEKFSRTFAEAEVERYAAKWDESKHPRGQSENAGEFASSPGSVPGKQKAARSGEMIGAKRVGKELALDNGEKAPEHIKPGMIPPAWTNVKVSTDKNSDVWVTGVDGKGRGKTIYSDSYTMRQAACKFARVSELIGERQDVANQIRRDMASDDPATREAAACMWLIEEQATRPGSDKDTKAKVKAHGATTLLGQHVVETPDGVRLQFIGKEGVYHDHLVRSPELAAELLRRKFGAGQDGKLFDTTDGKLLSYAKSLDHGRFTPKDFRTLKATTLAIDEISRRPKPANIKEHKAAVKEVATLVSRVLGNRPQQALESYIDPIVFSGWQLT